MIFRILVSDRRRLTCIGTREQKSFTSRYMMVNCESTALSWPRLSIMSNHSLLYWRRTLSELTPARIRSRICIDWVTRRIRWCWIRKENRVPYGCPRRRNVKTDGWRDERILTRGVPSRALGGTVAFWCVWWSRKSMAGGSEPRRWLISQRSW